MQVLYSLSRDNNLTYEELKSRYNKGIESAFDLYLFNLIYLIRIAKYAKNDLAKRRAKHLPTDADKLFTDKLWSNPLTQSIAGSEGLSALFDSHHLEQHLDNDTIRTIYILFSKDEEYLEYLNKEEANDNDHKEMVLKLYKTCTNHELFNEVMEDRYATWKDDKSLIAGTIKKTIKLLPSLGAFYEDFRPSDDTVVDFGENLLKDVCTRDTELLEIIEPTLKNWDADRVAVIDMILLKMAISELMIFPTIPTKVTLNEFVEISKTYSTEKSKDFINGILDRLMKKMNKEGKIKKEGRGLKE